MLWFPGGADDVTKILTSIVVAYMHVSYYFAVIYLSRIDHHAVAWFCLYELIVFILLLILEECQQSGC